MSHSKLPQESTTQFFDRIFESLLNEDETNTVTVSSRQRNLNPLSDHHRQESSNYARKSCHRSREINMSFLLLNIMTIPSYIRARLPPSS